MRIGWQEILLINLSFGISQIIDARNLLPKDLKHVVSQTSHEASTATRNARDSHPLLHRARVTATVADRSSHSSNEGRLQGRYVRLSNGEYSGLSEARAALSSIAAAQQAGSDPLGSGDDVVAPTASDGVQPIPGFRDPAAVPADPTGPEALSDISSTSVFVTPTPAIDLDPLSDKSFSATQTVVTQSSIASPLTSLPTGSQSSSTVSTQSILPESLSTTSSLTSPPVDFLSPWNTTMAMDASSQILRAGASLTPIAQDGILSPSPVSYNPTSSSSPAMQYSTNVMSTALSSLLSSGIARTFATGTGSVDLYQPSGTSGSMSAGSSQQSSIAQSGSTGVINMPTQSHAPFRNISIGDLIFPGDSVDSGHNSISGSATGVTCSGTSTRGIKTNYVTQVVTVQEVISVSAADMSGGLFSTELPSASWIYPDEQRPPPCTVVFPQFSGQSGNILHFDLSVQSTLLVTKKQPVLPGQANGDGGVGRLFGNAAPAEATPTSSSLGESSPSPHPEPQPQPQPLSTSPADSTVPPKDTPVSPKSSSDDEESHGVDSKPEAPAAPAHSNPQSDNGPQHEGVDVPPKQVSPNAPAAPDTPFGGSGNPRPSSPNPQVISHDGRPVALVLQPQDNSGNSHDGSQPLAPPSLPAQDAPPPRPAQIIGSDQPMQTTRPLMQGDNSDTKPQSPAVTAVANGTPIIVNPQNVIIGSQTFSHQACDSSAVVNGQVYSWNKQQVNAPGTTIPIPSAQPVSSAPLLTVGEHTFEVHPASIIVSGSTIPRPTSADCIAQTFSIGSSTFQINPSQIVQADRQIVLPSTSSCSTFAYRDETFSADESHVFAQSSTLPISSNGIVHLHNEELTMKPGQIICPSTTIKFISTPAPAATNSMRLVTFANVSFSLGPTAAVFGSDTYSFIAGKATQNITAQGKVIVAGPTGLRIGSDEIPLPTNAPSYSVVKEAGVTVSVAPSEAAVGDIRVENLQSGMIPITTQINGQHVKIDASGVMVAGHQIALPTPLSLSQQASTRVAGLQIEDSNSHLVIQGSTISPASANTTAAYTIANQTILVGPTDIQIKGTTVALPSFAANPSTSASQVSLSVGASRAVVGSVTFSIGPGASTQTATVGHEVIRAGPEGIIVPEQTNAIGSILPGTTIQPAELPTPTRFVGLDISVDASEAVIGSTTYAIGPGASETSLSISGQVLSFGAGGIQAASSTLQPWTSNESSFASTPSTMTLESSASSSSGVSMASSTSSLSPQMTSSALKAQMVPGKKIFTLWTASIFALVLLNYF